jgi:hypothetical protein
MMRLFFAFLLTAVVSSAACAQAIYTLNSAGSGQSEDVLGGNAALKASKFYDFMVKNWKVPTVEPIYKNDVIDNVEELIPFEVIVVPEMVTIHTSQKKGSEFDYERQNTLAVSPLPVTVNPAEDSVFIYAFNKDGKLIYPLAPIPSGDGKDYASIYRIQAFQEYSNFTSFFQPIVTNTDIDITGVYTKDRPNMNPPNALMFRGRAVGQYSLTLAVQFNSLFISVSTPDKVKELASKIVTKTVEVNVVDGPETIDQLLFNASRTLGIQDPSKDLSFAMKEGDCLEVSLSGRKFRKKWNEGSQQYRNDGSMNVMLKQANWNYSNLNQKFDAPYDTDLIFIRKMTADGASVHILANKLPSTATEGEGTITIDAHGRRFNINVRVVK